VQSLSKIQLFRAFPKVRDMYGTLKAARILEVAFESVRLSQTGLCENVHF
jgi:hypothetical protein